MNGLINALFGGSAAAALGIAGITYMAVLAGTLSIALACVVERRRMPAAVRLGELDQMIGAREAHADELQRRIEANKASLSERDQLEAEAEYWRSVVASTHAEYAGLSEQLAEIDRVREEHRAAVEKAEAAKGELESLERCAERARADIEAAKAAQKRLDELQQTETALDARVKELRETLEALIPEISRARADVELKRDEIENLGARDTHLRQRLTDLEREKANIEKDVAGLADAKSHLARAHEELRNVRDHSANIRAEIVERTHERASLDARLAQLKADIEKHPLPGPGGPDRLPHPPELTRDEVLSSLHQAPACLSASDWKEAAAQKSEQDALDLVADSLQGCGLHFPRRTLNAFHTSLKAAGASPMTVLSGISGTGKSQLPRRYAEAMGIHFLKIPVQPRWDSPQDLLGSYNYIEQRYRATEFSRMLVHLDEHCPDRPTTGDDYTDRMAMVLLDEMNLARVEYYFAEFLSRLEGRPANGHPGDETERRPSEIVIDVSAGGFDPVRIYPGRNVLFCGTMNEDESTLSLSDKVLDRANILRFPRPVGLQDSPTETNPIRANGYLSKGKWHDWARSPDKLSTKHKNLVKENIDAINDAMDKVGHPFGHRMNQAILSYVSNYPGADRETAIKMALADQVEQRVLPKLRGTSIDMGREPLHALASIIEAKLHDTELAESVRNATDDAHGIGLFAWGGLARTGS